jgi:hypothetical protein
LDNKIVVFALTKDDAPHCLSAVGLPQLYFDQLRVTKRHILHATLAVLHKAATGPKFNRWHLQQQLNWNEWQDAKLIQLDNYGKQNMFDPPCTAPIDASIFFWIWIYSIKPHENNQKKVRGICDVSTRGGHNMVHGATYAPTTHQIYFRIHMDLAANLDMYLWHANVSNAFAEAERPNQMYYMQCDTFFRDWWKRTHLDIPLLLDAIVLVLKNLQDNLKDRAFG